MGQLLYKKCKNLSILFVEDYLPLQKKIASVLCDYFGEVHTALNGKEGLEIYENYQEKNGKPFDIVMTDYEMPKLTGIELIKAIKEENENQVFIVISAHQNPKYLIEYINLDILYFIPKPLSPENILSVLSKVSDKFDSSKDELVHISDSLTWNKTKKSIFYNKELVILAKYDLLLFEILVEYFGLICPIDKILDYFYLNNEDVKQDNIRNMVVRLRKKIPNIKIINIYGIGYKLKI